MSMVILASIGGFISFLSTALGAVLSFFSSRLTTTPRFQLSIDFALGLMVSASAFTLIGPAALQAHAAHLQVTGIIAAAFVGAGFIYFLKSGVDITQRQSVISQNHLLLATALMIHNFPEGLASGAALAGLGWQASLPILGGITLQNVPEGALMVLCLRTLGVSMPWAFLGGIASGLVELGGGVLAGFLIESIHGILPFLLSAAGGAMLASVAIELLGGTEKTIERIASKQFALGLLILPFVQLLGGF